MYMYIAITNAARAQPFALPPARARDTRECRRQANCLYGFSYCLYRHEKGRLTALRVLGLVWDPRGTVEYCSLGSSGYCRVL